MIIFYPLLTDLTGCDFVLALCAPLRYRVKPCSRFSSSFWVSSFSFSLRRNLFRWLSKARYWSYCLSTAPCNGHRQNLNFHANKPLTGEAITSKAVTQFPSLCSLGQSNRSNRSSSSSLLAYEGTSFSKIGQCRLDYTALLLCVM